MGRVTVSRLPTSLWARLRGVAARVRLFGVIGDGRLLRVLWLTRRLLSTWEPTRARRERRVRSRVRSCASPVLPVLPCPPVWFMRRWVIWRRLDASIHFVVAGRVL